MRILLSLALFIAAQSCAMAEEKLGFLSAEKMISGEINTQSLRGTWFAIHEENWKWRLSKTPVTAVPAEESDMMLIQTKYKKVVGLLKAKNLSEGPLEAANLIVDELGIPQAFLFEGKKYSLVAKPVRRKIHSMESNNILIDNRYDVYLVGSNNPTPFYQSSGAPTIRWAGDIDRDRKPDLIAYFNDDNEKNSLLCLFLSSGTKNDQSLRVVGCQLFSG